MIAKRYLFGVEIAPAPKASNVSLSAGLEQYNNVDLLSPSE
jgi:hypothetical protein